MSFNNFRSLQEKRARYVNTARAIIDRAAAESRALRPGEEAEAESLALKIDALNRTMRIADRFATIDHDEPVATRTGLLDYVRAFDGARGNLDVAIQRARESNPSMVRALSASVATAGGFAVPDDYHSEVIEALRPAVAVRRLNPVVIPSPNGNVTWPKVNTASTTAYGVEGSTIPATQPGFGALQLTNRKQSALVPISNSLLRMASPAADLIVKNDLVASAAQLEDSAFIRGDGSNNSPRGLRYQALAANIIAANGTVNATNTSSDLKTLVSAIANANVRMIRPGFIFATRTEIYLRELRGSDGVRVFPEMIDGRLMGFPYASTNNVPTTLGGGSASEIYFADFADVVIADYPLVVNVGGAMTYKDAGGNTVSAFSNDQTVIGVIVQSDIGLRHRESLAVLTGVTWS